MNSFKYLEGGVELLDLAGPLWEKARYASRESFQAFLKQIIGVGFCRAEKRAIGKSRSGKAQGGIG